MSKKVKKRRLKKWVKKSLSVIIVIIFIIIISIIYMDIKEVSINDKEVSVDKKEDINNFANDEQTLNRVIYKDGFYYEELSQEVKSRITGKSYPLEFDDSFTMITYDDLSYIKVKYYDFEGVQHSDGEIIVNKLVAQDIVEIFYKLYLNKYSIASIKLVEEFNSSDELSMEANNTSAFCYRNVEKTDKLSWHAFGLAVDINPLYNPYIIGNDIYPQTASKYTDRTLDFKGMINHNDLAYKLFIEYGWKWGGDFIYSKDYQHFYKEIYDNSIRERK